MPRLSPEQTRQEIIDAAAGLFATAGFRGTSLQRIADEVGYSKSALLYHFSSKVEILRELIAPGAADLADLDRQLARLSARRAQRAAAEGFVDLAVRYRSVLVVLWPAVPEVMGTPGFEDIAAQAQRLQHALAGRSDAPAATITAVALLAGMTSACSELADLPDDTLRPALLTLVRRALELPRPAA